MYSRFMTKEAKILSLIGVVTVIGLFVAAFTLGGSQSPEKKAKPVDTQLLVRENSHTEGDKDAKVTLVEFGDFQCPACGASHPIVKQIVNEYKGKVKFVYRNFPLSMHKNAKVAAYAAEAAGAQGKFFEMHDALFNEQKEWSESKDPMEHFKKYAKNIGVEDLERFEKEITDKKYENIIKKDLDDGNVAGVTATPTFFINGVIHSGGMPYDQFKKTIDEALAGK